jgi:tRNA A37 threonylcarbamoyladenosine dehydratase
VPHADRARAGAEPALDRRFGGLQRLYGLDGWQRLRSAHIAVVGLGGVGSWVAESLARSGVGALTLIDFDHLAESNINRQIHACDATLGMSKVQAMRDRIASYHPQCRVHTVDDFATPENWPALLPQPVDGVVDACDQTVAKVGIGAWARATSTALVLVGAAGGKRLPQAVEVQDLAQVSHDPVLARVRQALRKQHGAPSAPALMGLPCVFSREPVQPPDASCAVEGDGSLNCHGYGSCVAVTATFGHCAAAAIMNQLVATPTRR